ncbi:hypothetical protein BDV96DRAFT_550988 [Lophiotrema nucula]|uniref:Autophagy-related protein 2 n=1 Tax=Lophiotrema nucula TaxID=690887 RepID=A0A6A5YZT3_9PLEO|nr:hypothetical protein BDV96DRAFT_550988 [Lophiotrema nucula]
MAFLAALSSSIGKKLLISALRHVDIFDTDPANFVSVAVGKRTTLEARDVGLHVKKLIALLRLKLPPEFHLCKARASLLRITFVLDFGVPQILIDIDGIQIHARLAEDAESKENKRKPPTRRQASPPALRPFASPPPPDDDASDSESDADNEYVPTVDELAKSILREEPAEEIRELEDALNTQSEHLAESVASSDDGDEGSTEGLGAPLGLPLMLRNVINTALDRLEVVANHIDIQVEDQLPAEPSSASSDTEEPFVSLNFHIARVAIDSLTSQDPRVDVASSALPAADPTSRLGKRRMRVESICARLISDADNFASMSRVSRASSPIDTRSEISTSQRSRTDAPTSQVSSKPPSTIHDSIRSLSQPAATMADSQSGALGATEPSPPVKRRSSRNLASSTLTDDEDRFADAEAASDDGLDRSIMYDSSVQSRHSLPPPEMTASSMLYDDEDAMQYALDNSLLNSRMQEAPVAGSFTDYANQWEVDGATLSRGARSSSGSGPIEPTMSDLFSPPTLQQSSRSLANAQPSVHHELAEAPAVSGEPSDITQSPRLVDDASDTFPQTPRSPSPEQEDLSESKLFTHDDAESMYMSALSGAGSTSSHHPAIPGAWDSASSSSQDTASDSSAPIPASMVAGSILGPLPEADDGCETPRPGSRQSVFGSPNEPRTPSGVTKLSYVDSGLENKVSKLFLSIDTITCWFPLGLGEAPANEGLDESFYPDSGLSFAPPNLAQDSIFQEMPGSFSNYARSASTKRRASANVPESKRPSNIKPSISNETAKATKKDPHATISVEVGTVVGHIDFSTGRIMFQLVDRLLKSLTGASSDQKSSRQDDSPHDSRMSIQLAVKHVGISWLERLMTESVADITATSRPLELSPLDAILRITLSTIHIASQSAAEEARAKLSIGKFALSSLNDDILSFHTPKARSRRSITNLPDQLESDIEIDYEQGKDRRISIVTRPVKINFDMQKLDEALSSFGGFSGVLELGSSINSNLTNSPTMSTARPKPRGVHFGDAPPPPAPTTSSGMPKIDVQFGEVNFALKGKICALQLQTTSVRVAVRANNLRMKVTEVNLSGPYVDAAQKGAPLMVEVKGTTVNFLFAPEEVDLARLISMITPSKDPYENDEDILIDTLLRQRRKGSVLRVDVANVGLRLSDLAQLHTLEALGAEVAKLSKVTRYLPDDDRPGILTLAKVQQLDASVTVNERLGDVSMACKDTSMAHVGVPALFALEVGDLSVRRGKETLISEVVHLRPLDQLPMIMARIIGDEMEPVVKAKLYNVCAEYHVTTIMAALGISDDGTVDDIALGLASSVATITGTSPKTLSRQTSESSSPSATESKPLQIDILLRGCAIGLNPRKIPSKGLFVFTDARISGHQSKKDDYSMSLELRSSSVIAIDDIARIGDDEVAPSRASAGSTFGERQLKNLQEDGFVSLGSISGARVQVDIIGEGKDKPQIIDVEFQTKLFLLESCADSTQTLIAILNGLQPPMPPSTAVQYRTVVPLTQMMESFTGDAVFAPEEADDENFMENADLVADEVPTNLEFVGSFYNPESLPSEEDLGDSMLGEDDLGALAPAPTVRQRGERGLLESFQEQYEVTAGEQDFDFDDNYFKDSDSDVEHKGTARKWDSKKNKYQLTNEFKTPDAPLKVRVRDLNIIWNLFDGYDWPRTRGVIAQAVEDVEARAEERRRRPREDDTDEDFVEADYLFNSVWIGVPVKDEKGALTRAINHDIDDLVSETGSYATSTATRSTGATARPRSATKSHRRKLKLERSKHKKISFDLRGISVDLVIYPPNTGETQNSINLRIQNFEIYDHVPSSTWRKFATSLINPSEREMNRPMINLELLTVKPVTDLAASELVIKVTVQPLRLHVDQDALDFITRFFEFKDDTVAEPGGPSDQPFIQRLEVMSVTLKLDYKPKRIDYRGLRSGHTTEFMNFLILDGSDIVLRHAIVYGITSFDKLNKTLNDVWMPDIKRNQLPGVLAGLAAVRPLVNVGSGMRDLVVVPMREYKKDGRIVRSLQKGVYAFSKNTTSEIARLGAKVAIGAQTALEGAEKFLNPQHASPRSPSALHDWDDLDPDASGEEEPRAHSNYANQPIGVKAGLLTAAKHLERDMLTAKDAIIAIPSEVWEEGTGIGMAKVVAKRAPTIILRPALGATKAVSNALMGVGNALDKDSRRKIEDKYKSY